MTSLFVAIPLAALWGFLSVVLFPDLWLIPSVLGGFVIGFVCSHVFD